MTDQTVLIRFKGEDDVSSTAKTVEESVSNVGKVAEQSGSKFGSMSTIAAGALTQIGMSITNLAADLGMKALGAVSDFVSGSIEEASSWQTAMAQTEAVIKSTGGAAGITAQQMGEMASAMSASEGMSLFSDDAILGAQNVLATFTQIKGETFGGATQSILDMSQALGQDLQSSTMQVGKALNDPIKGIAALSRVGVTFSEDQKAMIQSLQETGDMAGAQQVILDELSREFGGSAAAAVNTYAGSQVILQERIAGIQQTLGEALLPVIMKLTAWLADSAIPVIQDIVGRFSEWLTTMDDFGVITEVLDMISSGFTTIQTSAGSLSPALAAVSTWISPISDAFMNAAAVAVPALTALGGALMSNLASPEYQGALSALMSVLGALADVVQTLLVLAFNTAAQEWKLLTEGFQIAWPYIQTVLGSFYSLAGIVFTYISGLLQTVSLLLKGDFSGAWTMLSTTVQTAMSSIWSWIQDTFSKINTFLGDIGSKFSEIGSQIVAGIAAGISSGADKIKQAALDAANAAYEAMKSALGIASPSRIMADKIGLPISQGVAAGIIKGSGYVSSAAGMIAQAGTNATVNNYYQLSASYAQTQSEGSIISDLQRMQIQYGGIL